MRTQPRMPAILLAGVVVLTAVLGATAASAQSAAPVYTGPAGTGSLAGLWVKGNYRSVTLASLNISGLNKAQKTVDGQLPPLQPWARAELEERIKRSDEGDPIPTTQARCLPGFPMMLLGGGAYALQILETPGQVTMLFEEQNHFRLIHVDGKHPDDPDPSYMGNSVGHWEGDTFVVDTTAFVADTPLDWVGMPHSDQLHLIERYRRTDKDTLEVLITIDDPKTFTKRWDAKQVLKAAPASRTLSEYVCDNNRDEPK